MTVALSLDVWSVKWYSSIMKLSIVTCVLVLGILFIALMCHENVSQISIFCVDMSLLPEGIV